MDYRDLYEKHAKRQKTRGYLAIAAGVANIVTGIMLLRQLRDEQQQQD